MSNSSEKISIVSRILLVLSGLALIVSVYVPIWYIDLDAPQYPEGLNLKIYADKIGGNVEIINGLNHYIGMKTLHTEDFFEFKVLPYILWAFAAFCLLAAFAGRKKLTGVLLIAFIVFGVVSMVDFWRWEYEYGHDLDPNAAIIVPGMAYQPPLIGFKQLLNFGAYSMPDIGGWLMLAAGIMILLAVYIEFRKGRKMMKQVNKTASALFVLVALGSCGHKPQPIRLNQDNCSYCEMTISDRKFGTELMTEKGRIYKFDDLSCMLRYMKENNTQVYKGVYISDFLSPHNLLRVEETTLVQGDAVSSPMGGNFAGFSNKDSANNLMVKLNAKAVNWADIKP